MKSLRLLTIITKNGGSRTWSSSTLSGETPRAAVRLRRDFSATSFLSSSSSSQKHREKPKRESDERIAKKFSEIPGPRPSLPLVGTSWQYFKYVGRYDLFKLHEANLERYREYGNIFREEYQAGNPVVHLFDPSDFEKVFRSQGKYPNRPPNEFVCAYRKRNPDKYPTVGMAHLLGEEWYAERQLLAPALLKLGVLQNHIDSQNKVCDDFVRYIEAEKTGHQSEDMIGDLREVTYRHALESICMMCLDQRMGCLSSDGTRTADGEALISSTKLLFEAYQELYYGSPLWKLYDTKSFKKLVKAEETIYEVASRHIERAQSRHVKKFEAAKKEQERALAGDPAHKEANDSSTTESVLQTLLNTKDIDERNVKITILDFISAGIFTVSNSLAYLLHNLAANPEVQEKLYKELISVVKDKRAPVTMEHLSRMPYLKACVKESFRLTSTVPSIVRVLPETAVLSGYEIPSGTTVFCHFLVCCLLPEYFDEPEKYHPDRWLGKARQSIHPFVLLPFGFGNRMCVGRRFSELELYLSTAKVVLNYELELSGSGENSKNKSRSLERRHAFIVIPAHPIPVKFRPRS